MRHRIKCLTKIQENYIGLDILVKTFGPVIYHRYCWLEKKILGSLFVLDLREWNDQNVFALVFSLSYKNSKSTQPSFCLRCLIFLYGKVLSSSWKVSLVRSGEVNLLPILLIHEVNQGSTLWWWVRWLRMYEVTLLQPSIGHQLSGSLSNLPVLTFLYSPWHLLLLIATDRNVPTWSGVICPLRVCIWRWCLRLAFFCGRQGVDVWHGGHAF